jgi:hypothetical protein
MKKYILLSLFVAATCSNVLFAQNRETRKVENFTKIALRVAGNVVLKQGSPQSVEIEGDKDILKEIETNVEGSKLVIERDGKWNDWNSEKKVTIYITVEKIDALSVSGSGSIEAQNKITTGDIDVAVSGSGSLKAEIDATGDMNANVSGSGSIDLRGKCRALDSDLSGSGNVKLDLAVAGKADFSVSGSGRVQSSGSANEVKATISGSGKVLAANMEASRCEVKISGSGNVEINVKDELDANISGSGSIAYKGNPSKVNSNSSGSGKVSKM